MKDPLLVIAMILALAVFYVMLPVFMNVLACYRGNKILTCPERNQMASIGIDAKKAALSAIVGYENVQVKHCSLWQEKGGCNQKCLSQL